MNETEAQEWIIANFDVSRETLERLEAFVGFVRNEAQSQNLIARSTVDHIWQRHVVDSAQLLLHVPGAIAGEWIDLGAGAGFPGIVTALLGGHRTLLVESRAKRIDYLQRAVAMLDLEDQISVAGMPLERVPTHEYAVISARAFAPLPKLLELAARFSTQNTTWLLPKGRNAAKEYGDCREIWPIAFEIKPSITDDEAGILVGKLLSSADKPLKMKAEQK